MSEEPTPLPLADHLSAVVERRLAQLIQSLAASHEPHSTETVHDLRVASRRLRAFGVTFGGLMGDKLSRRLEKKLRRVTRAAGGLRDLDVQVGLLEERVAVASNELERACLEHLLERLDDGRAAVAARAEKRLHKLDQDALSRLVTRAGSAVTEGLPTVEGQRDYARTLLQRLITSAAEPMLDTERAEDPERLHRLRIQCKEIRYALEFFEPLLGSHFQLLEERATRLQDLLGKVHDLITLEELLAEHAGQLERKGRHTLRAGAEHAVEALRAQRAVLVERFHVRGFDPDGWRAALDEALTPGR